MRDRDEDHQPMIPTKQEVDRFRRWIACVLHPSSDYCRRCDPSFIYGTCDRCRGSSSRSEGRLYRDVNGTVRCSTCGAEYDLRLKYVDRTL